MVTVTGVPTSGIRAVVGIQTSSREASRPGQLKRDELVVKRATMSPEASA